MCDTIVCKECRFRITQEQMYQPDSIIGCPCCNKNPEFLQTTTKNGIAI